MKPRILFFAENVTLAHVGRMITLADSLDPDRFDVSVACGDRYSDFVTDAGLRHVVAETMAPDYFADRLAQGRVVHTRKLLERMVANDLDILSQEKPDLVVSDFRVSLGLSAELAGVPLTTVANAYWSPHSTVDFQPPEHPAVRLFGLSVVKMMLPVIAPMTFRALLRPMNQLRREHGLTALSSLQQMYTHGTWTLFADTPALAPVDTLCSDQRYLGPVMWEPPVELPTWWNSLPEDKPIIYVNVGSSGHKGMLAAVLEGLKDVDATVMVATAGFEPETDLPDNVRLASYLPGMAACERASLVICNGGSGTIYQALCNAVPVLGIPSNGDQYLAMQSVLDQGAGVVIRAGQVNGARIRHAVDRIIDDPGLAERAKVQAELINAMSAPHAFNAFIDEAFDALDAKPLAA